MRYLKLLFISILSMFLFANLLVAQTTENPPAKKVAKGSISGQIIDAKTGETLPGVIIAIDGTTIAAVTDMDGKYLLNNLTPGTYKFILKYVGYTTKEVGGVIVKPGETTTLNSSLDASTSELQEVVVVAKANEETTASLVIQQKNNASVSDGVSAETIKRTPDRTTSDVLKRVSGTTIQENKFAIIRGLNDRYNAAFINGAPLPSSESDRKAFAFDIFPANALDNIIILKTGTPEMPGEFAGGVIQINTKSIPEENKQVISVSGSYNEFTTFKNFKSYDGGKTDWLGIDDGTRALPAAIPSSTTMGIASTEDKALYAKKMNYNWALTSGKAIPNANLQYSLGRTIKLFNRDFGILTALTYQKNFNVNYTTRKDFEGETGDVIIPRVSLEDTTYNENTLTSALLNLSYKISPNHQIGVKNIFSINSDDRVTVRAGARDLDQTEKTWERSSVRWFTQNMFFSGQLGGDHLILKDKLKINWSLGVSDIQRDIPSMRRNVYQKISLKESDETIPYVAVIQQNGVSTFGGGNMFFSKTNEQVRSAKYDISYPLDFWKMKNTFKVGGYHQFRKRDFYARNFGFSKYRKGSSIKFVDTLLTLPDDKIFADRNLGIIDGLPSPVNGGFKLDEATKVSDSYDAASNLHAGYIMFDNRFKERLRLVWGARVESYQQLFNYVEFGSNKQRNIDTTVVDWLPSMNLIYSLTEKMNLRLAYYKTVSRPEFRELAPFAFYNFILDNIWTGDPTLKRAQIYNYDFRYEWYPSGAQMISASAFYKDFMDPIETVNRNAVSGAPELYYTNIPKSTNYGAELEYRVKLSIFSKTDSSVFLNNTTLFSNLAIINSEVDNSAIPGATKRPLQGQSPYVVNAGVMFTHPTYQFSISAAYNVVGRRIWIVGNTQEPDIWEAPRHVVDLQLSKTFIKNLEVKFNARDILAQNQLFYQDIDKNGKADKGVDNFIIETRFAPTYSFSVSYKF